MTLLLLLAAAVFGLLAVDAWRIGRPPHDAPYQVEAKERGESVAGVPVSEQLRRQAWHRRFGLGAPGEIVWLWSILAGGCLAAALFREFG
jgi:hypothetical protein